MTERQKQLFEQHREWAVEQGLRVFRSRTGGKCPRDPDGNDRHDYAQAAMVALLEVLPGYRASQAGSFEAYAAKRVTGRIIQQFRDQDEVGRSQRDRGVQHPRTLLDHPLMSDDSQRLACFRDLIRAPSTACRAEVFDSLHSLLFGLHLGQRAVVFLTIVNEYSDALIACVLGISSTRVGELRRGGLEYLARQGRSPKRRHWRTTDRGAGLARQLPLFDDEITDDNPAALTTA